MSFSYGSVPEPESPPLKALALSPAPARTDRRAKRHTTLSPNMPDIASLDLNDDPLSLDGLRGLQRSVSARPTPRPSVTGGAATVTSAMSIHQTLTTYNNYNSSAGTLITPMPIMTMSAPRMINPLPAHYRHPSPSPSYESSTPSLTAADSNCSSCSATSATSNGSSISSASSSGMKRRKSLIAKPSIGNMRSSSKAPHSSDDSLSSSCEPHTPTSTTFSRSRGKSISRAVGKLASDFLSLKKKDKESSKDKDRSDADCIPAVPALPSCRK